MNKHRCVFLLLLFLVPFTLAQGQHKCITQTVAGDPAKYDFGVHQMELTRPSACVAEMQVQVCANHLNRQQFERAGFNEACSADPQFYSGFKKIVVYELDPDASCGVLPELGITIFATIDDPNETNPRICVRSSSGDCDCGIEGFSPEGTDPVFRRSKTSDLYWGNEELPASPAVPLCGFFEFLPPLDGGLEVAYEANVGEVIPVKFNCCTDDTCDEPIGPPAEFSISVANIDDFQFIIPSSRGESIGLDTNFEFIGRHWHFDVPLDPLFFESGNSYAITVLCQTNNCNAQTAVIDVK